MSAVLQQNDQEFKQELNKRQRRSGRWARFFSFANLIAFIALIVLVLHILNGTFGLVVIVNSVEPATLSDRPLEELSSEEVAGILSAQLGNRVRVIIRDTMSAVPAEYFTTSPLSLVLAGREYPSEWATLTINDLTPEQLQTILVQNFSQGDLVDILQNQVIQPRIVESWRFIDSVSNRAEIEQIAAERFPEGTLRFQAWLDFDFLTSSASSSASTTGLRTALFGSAWIILITALVAFPLGIGAAIYLQEYAKSNWVNRLIEINIRNLAAVPSIIYGMLGLAVFVRALSVLTSGQAFGVTDSSGRTILSAGFTLALLILPVIIINAQEALRAVPSSIRDASYGLGATKWQTVQRQVLPMAAPGILTGIILAMSRAVGETAPLIVVGASTFITFDPNGPFSRFTVVPIQIYEWTANPNQEFRNVAAAAIIVLLIVMILLNGTAIILRNRFSKRYA